MLEGQGWCSKLPQADCERWYRSKREARLGVHGLESVFFCEWSGGKCGSAAPVSCEPLSAGTAGAKPNLLFFLTDDWSFEMWPGRTEEEAQPQGMRELLPRLSATFVDDGLSLERHYTTFVCVPSRHSFLSGRLPHHLDLTNNLCRGLPLEMDTIADRLKAAGYVTHFVGKWNVGVASSRLLPAQRGFDSTLGFLQHAHHHFKHTDVSLDEGEPPLYDFFVGEDGEDVCLGRQHPSVKAEVLSTQVYEERAVAIVSNHDVAVPLFLFVSFSAPHAPLMERQRHLDRASHARGEVHEACEWNQVPGTHWPCNQENRMKYEAMMSGVDEAVGRVEDALRSRGMWSHSLLAFASDNGGSLPGMMSNRPLSGGKGGLLEGGVRTVAALGGGWLPQRVRGRASEALVHISDWYATLLSAAGGDFGSGSNLGASAHVHPPDSVNVLPALLDEASLSGGSGGGSWARRLGGERTVVLWTGQDSALLKVHRYKNGKVGLLKLISGRGCVSKVPEDRPCIECYGEYGCVFDVLADPAEKTDIVGTLSASEKQALSDALDAAQDEWRERRDASAAREWPAGSVNRNPHCNGLEIRAYARANGNVIQPWL